MGKTSNEAKQRWSAERRRQVKVAASPETAAALKAACAAGGQSVNGAIMRYMEAAARDGLGRRPPSLRVAARPQRRAAAEAVLEMLRGIRDAEEGYLGRIPENLQGGERHEAAGQSVDAINEAIERLEAY
jgi:hypothetical protein